MKSRGIVGRRIVAIEQRRVFIHDSDNASCWNVAAIVLDNGVVLRPLTIETDHGEYCTEMIINTQGKRKRGAAATT